MHKTTFRFISVGVIVLTSTVSTYAQERSVLFDSSDVSITKMKCNTSSSDYAPAFCDGGIIFSSDRPHGFGVLSSDSLTPDNMYFIPKRGSSPEFINKLNTLLQEGTASYSTFDGVLYFSGSYRVKDHYELGIYASQRNKDGGWSTPTPVIFPADSISYFQPCVLDNGNTLLIASDRRDGFGGTDLYRSVKENGTWSIPVNLGPQINTSGDEGYPSFCAPGILIFSSTAHGSIGGYDNFCCSYKAGIVGAIIPVGAKLNSSADDFGMIYDSDSRIGYFTSDRDKSTGDDLYEFTLSWPHFSNCVAYVIPRYCYTFSEENSMASSDTAMFYYQWSFGDGSIAEALEVDHCFAGPGVYNVELMIRDRKDTSFFMTQVIYEHEIAEKPGLRINGADTIFVGDSIFLNADNSSLEGFSILRYYWDFGDHLLVKRPQVVFVPSESGRLTLQLGVAAKSNPIRYESGPDEEYFCTEKNVVVLHASERQAWLSKQGGYRHSDTVLAAGVPVFDLAQIENPDYAVFLGSSKDSVTFPQPGTQAIIRIVKEGDVYRYLYGSAENMRAIHVSYVELKELGIDSAFVIVLSSDTIVGNQINPQRDFRYTEIISKMILDTIPQAAIIPVNITTGASDTLIIYFDVNQSTLNEKMMSQIDSMLQSPSSSYRLVAFSDQSGNDAYNLKLSKTRSGAVASHLRSKGVKRSAISQDSYGEDRPAEFRSTLNRLEHNRCVIIIAAPALNN